MYKRFFEMSDDLKSVNKIGPKGVEPQFANSTLLNFFGISEKEFLNSRGIDFSNERSLEDKERLRKTLFDEGSIRNLEQELKGKNGNKWFNLSIKLDRDFDHLYIIASDIDKTVKQKEQLETKTNELKNSYKELTNFTYAVSHDLQEPVRNINSLTEILLEEHSSNLNTDGKHLMQLISDSSDRLKDLVIALLDNSRIGKNEEMEVIDLNQIITAVKTDLIILIQDNNVQINSDELPQIKGSRIRIYQLFQNLILNAIKYRKKGVTPIIEIKYNGTLNNHFFHVSDNGIGIKKKHQEEIFGIFKRLHTHEEIPGLGIGLANCKKIVEQHEGEISVSSDGEQGSTFKISLKKWK